MNKFSKIICIAFAFSFSAQAALFAQQKVRVHFRVIEEDTRKIIPVMVCITNVKDSQVYLPPEGKIAGEPSFPNHFFNGIDFENDRNWVGPVRKMNGKGVVNGQRTYVYGSNPSIPHWKEPVMYQVSGDFTVDLIPGQWHISVEHGNEYIPIKFSFAITGKQKEWTKLFVLKRWINLPPAGLVFR